MSANKSPSIVEFINARLDEAEDGILNGWDSDGRARVASMWTGSGLGYTTVASDHGDGHWIADGREVSDARRVKVLFDPAYVLADIAAKRRILVWHGEPYDEPGFGLACDACGHGTPDWGPGDRASFHPTLWPCPTLRALAAPFSSHPDYDQSWQLS